MQVPLFVSTKPTKDNFELKLKQVNKSPIIYH